MIGNKKILIVEHARNFHSLDCRYIVFRQYTVQSSCGFDMDLQSSFDLVSCLMEDDGLQGVAVAVIQCNRGESL